MGWNSWSIVGRIDSSGRIYLDSISDSLGRVENGEIFEGGGYSFYRVGRVENGEIFEGSHSWSPIGEVDSDGNIFSTDAAIRSLFHLHTEEVSEHENEHNAEEESEHENEYNTEESFYSDERYDASEEHDGIRQSYSYQFQPSASSPIHDIGVSLMGADMRNTAIYTVVWAFIALLFGWLIYSIDPSWAFFSTPGILLMLSGVFAMPLAVLIFMRRFHTITVIICVISAIFGLLAIIGFYGIIIAFKIYKAKGEFVD